MRKRSDETKGVIIAVARDLFFKVGYQLTTIEKIACHARITKRTLYGYFPDKKALFLAVIKETVGLPLVFSAPVDAIDSSDDLYRTLVNIAKGLNDTYSSPNYVGLLRVIISELSNQPDLIDVRVSGVTQRAYEIVVEIFKDADKKGIIASKEPELQAESFVGGLLFDYYMSGLLSPDTATMRRLTHEELLTYVSTCAPLLNVNILDKH